MFSIMQLALIYVAKEVVTYASYSAARAALVAETPEEAYERAQRAGATVCAPITGDTVAGATVTVADLDAAAITVPGWGRIAKSGISNALKTHVSSIEVEPDYVRVTVTHYYELTFPVVNYVFAWMHADHAPEIPDATGWMGTDVRGDEAEYEASVGIWNIEVPHMRLRETTILAVPGTEDLSAVPVP